MCPKGLGQSVGNEMHFFAMSNDKFCFVLDVLHGDCVDKVGHVAWLVAFQ